MAYTKGMLHNNNAGTQRGRSYALILLITFGAALLGVMVLHRLRERRIYNLIVKEKDHHLLALQLLLQKEQEHAKELSRKNEEMKAKVYALRNQKMELDRTIVEMQSTMDSLKDEQKLIESAFEDNQRELRMMQEKGSNLILGQFGGSDIRALRENLKQKEAEIQVLKHHLKSPVDDHPTVFPKNVAVNGTVEAQNKTENVDEHSTVEGVTAERKEEIRINEEEQEKKNENLQDDGSAGATTKENGAEVVEDTEKKAGKDEQQGQNENNSHGERQDSNAKQSSGMKKKHGNLSRTKGGRWRTIVKNKLMENNGILERQGQVNLGSTKVYKDEKNELKDRTVGRDYDENESIGNDKVKDSGNHENTEDGNNTTAEKPRLHEMRQLGEQRDGLVQQNWSRRRINNAGETESNMLLEEPEELEVLDVQKQGKDAIDEGDEEEEDSNDEFFKESQTEFEDEKEEYKEEIDESEFQHGL